MLMMLTFEEFKDLTGYSYSELEVKLSTPKNGDYGGRMIVIENTTNLQEVFKKVSEKSFQKGLDEQKIKDLK